MLQYKKKLLYKRCLLFGNFFENEKTYFMISSWSVHLLFCVPMSVLGC